VPDSVMPKLRTEFAKMRLVLSEHSACPNGRTTNEHLVEIREVFWHRESVMHCESATLHSLIASLFSCTQELPRREYCQRIVAWAI
jgi:hypothetical protein